MSSPHPPDDRGAQPVPPGFDNTATTGPIPRKPTMPGERPADPETWVWNVDLPKISPYAWGEFATLIAARNEELMRLSLIKRDIANTIREGWMEALDKRPDVRPADCTMAVDEPRMKFLILGDPGEGDLSQWALGRPLLARQRAAADDGYPIDFGVILSDVVYPAGSAIEYRDRFHGNVRELTMPIYAIPGNHDWDDGSLASFVHTFVDLPPSLALPPADPQPAPRMLSWIVPEPVQRRLRDLGRRRFVWSVDAWDGGSAFRRLRALRDIRDARVLPGAFPKHQPASYFAVDCAGVRIVAIDQGFSSDQPMDPVQATWLRTQLGTDRPVVMLVGKPLVTHGTLKGKQQIPGGAGAGERALPQVVADAPSVVAVIGGDVHNYQRYTQANGVRLIVSGAAGAYMSGNVGVTLGLGEHNRKAGPGEALKDETLYPTEDQSRWYLARQLRTRLLQAPVGVALAALCACVFSAGASVWAGLTQPMWPRDGYVAVGTLAAAAILWRAWAARRDPATDPATGRWRGILGTLGYACLVAGVGVGLAAMLALTLRHETPSDLSRLASILLFPTAVGIVGAALLPFGVLSQVFPLPSYRATPSMVGCLGLTWLLAVGLPPLADAQVLPDSTAFKVALIVVPAGLVFPGYGYYVLRGRAVGAPRFQPIPFIVGAAAFFAGLFLVAAHLFFDWGPRLTLGVVGALGLATFLLVLAARILALAGRGCEGDTRLLNGGQRVATTVFVALFVLVVWAVVVVQRVDQPADALRSGLGRALAPSLFLVLAFGAFSFLVLRLAGPSIPRSRGFMRWLAETRSGVDAWSVLETAEPPFFKSFLEVDVDETARSIRVRCWGVSGFETDADDPILVDDFHIPWERPPAPT